MSGQLATLHSATMASNGWTRIADTDAHEGPFTAFYVASDAVFHADTVATTGDKPSDSDTFSAGAVVPWPLDSIKLTSGVIYAATK